MTGIQQATGADLAGVLELLRDSALPVDGLIEHRDTLLIARDGEHIVGCAAVELYGEWGLLRSVAVAASTRGTGLGHALVNAAVNLACQRGVRALFLLTTTAENFFPRFGFERVDRADIPEALRQSVELTSACPASAIVMRKHITVAV